MKRCGNFLELGSVFKLLNGLVAGEAYKKLFLAKIDSVFFNIEQGSENIMRTFLRITEWDASH